MLTFFSIIQKFLLERTELLAILINFIGTLGGVLVGSYWTYFLYKQEKKDKETQQTKDLEMEQVKAANELIIHLWTALSDTMSNNEVVDKQRNIFTNPDPNDDRTSYVVEANYDWNVVKTKAQYFIEKLPCLTLYSVWLEESFKWSRTYRERRNHLIKTNTKSGYEEKCQHEYKNNKHLIRFLSEMLLVIYDYASTRWKREYTILRISKRKYISNVWLYLDDDFTKTYVQADMQYEFQNPALARWFFRMLKNECRKNAKNKKNAKK